MNEIEAVLQFWFGDLDVRGCADEAHSARWWRKEDAFDAEVRARFGALHAAVSAGEHEAWLTSDRGVLAHVIVLDQFSRNMFRGSARAFASDGLALRAALAAIAAGTDRRLRCDERSFLYMPLMHSEDMSVQDRCVALFAAMADEVGEPLRERVGGSLSFAQRHRDIIVRFGRFPHRNALLGRTSTVDEVDFLAQPGSSF
jgi:uncharacterized protein (DUF924 family)